MAHQQSGDPQAPQAEGASEAQRTTVYLKILGGDFGSAQLWFRSKVLDRYRQQAGFRVMRTDTVGRVRAQGGWSLDFGIADGDRLIHAALADLGQRVPAAEHRHWLEHLQAAPLSRNYLLMRLGGGSCIDDGEVRDWPG